MTAQRCEWCGGELRPKQKATCSNPCRAGRWRWLNGVLRAGGQPPEPPAWSGSPLLGRMGENRSNTAPAPAPAPLSPATGPRSGANARSGVMLSYRKAVAACSTALSRAGRPDLAAVAESALRDALAPAQRRKVEARDA